MFFSINIQGYICFLAEIYKDINVFLAEIYKDKNVF